MMPLRRILAPTDFSESARRALDYGLAFARDYQAELILLHVVEAVPVGYASDLFPVPVAEMYQEVSAYARAELAKLAAEAAGQGVTTRERVLQGKPSAEIVRLAAEEAVDLIVLGTHGKDLLDQAIFGSTTERVVRKAPCPVLTCHALERGAKPKV